MKTSQNNINDQGKFSSKNDRYNLTGFHRDQFYIPTESNFINQNQRRVTSTTYRKNKFSQEQTDFPRVYTSGCPHNTANLYLNKKNFSFKKKPSNKSNKYFTCLINGQNTKKNVDFKMNEWNFLHCSVNYPDSKFYIASENRGEKSLSSFSDILSHKLSEVPSFPEWHHIGLEEMLRCEELNWIRSR